MPICHFLEVVETVTIQFYSKILYIDTDGIIFHRNGYDIQTQIFGLSNRLPKMRPKGNLWKIGPNKKAIKSQK